jgi:hypothetical protein
MQDCKKTATKKNEAKKLQLSRETPQTLQDSDSRKIMAGLAVKITADQSANRVAKQATNAGLPRASTEPGSG